MDRQTVFTKTAKGLMEATGKTSLLSRDMRALLKEIDGKATFGEVHAKLGKVPEAKLQEALQVLLKSDFIRQFSQAAPTAAPPQKQAPQKPAETEIDLDFTMAIPTIPAAAKKAEEDARQKAEAEARAKADAAARARAAAEAAARAKAEAEARAKAEAEAMAVAQAAARAKAAAEAAAEAAARAKAEADARTMREAEERARREAEEKARQEAEARAKAQEQARIEAEERARKEAEELRAKLEEERKARQEAERIAKENAERERREAEERARREADELRAKLEEERHAREEAERKAKEDAERERRQAEEKARREADELRARLEEDRRAREEAERRAKEDAERERRQAEEKARQEADELRARLEEERRAREEAERKAKEEAERRAREEAERSAKEAAERERREAEDKARRDAEERARTEAEERARAQEQARIEAEAEARRQAEEAERREREAQERAERERREAAEKARREAEEQARIEAEARRQAAEAERRETEEKARREAEEKARIEAERREREAQERAERERREAEETARREAEEQARIEAEQRARAQEQTRIEAEAQARRRAEDAERAHQEAAEQAERDAAQPLPAQQPSGLDDMVRIETDFDAVLSAGAGAAHEAPKPHEEADNQLRKEIEERADREAGERARAEEQARIEAEEERRRDAEAGPRQDDAPAEAAEVSTLVEREQAEAEAQALLDAQNAETERHFSDMEKELDAEQAAAPAGKQETAPPERAPWRRKKEAKATARAIAAAQARASEPESEAEAEANAEAGAAYEPVDLRARINWGKPVALGLFLLLSLGLVLVHFVSFDGYIPQFEKLAGGYLQQPVKIKALHLSLVPQPHWRLDGVTVGSEGQLTVARVNAVAELGSMFSDKKAFTSIELESPVIGEQGMLSLLFGKPTGQDFKVASIVAKSAKLDSKTVVLPALDAKIAFGADGAWQQIALETPDHKTSLLLKPEGEGAKLEVETNAFSLPFDPAFILENFLAKGMIRRGELRLDEFKGGIFGGYLSGNANLKWGADWSLSGEIAVRAMDPARFAPTLIGDGKLEGKATYAMRAKSYDQLFAAPRLEGGFDIQKGMLFGVDLGQLLQGGGAGGKTAFTELAGNFVREAGKTQLRQIHLLAGPVSAGGAADADAAKRLSGRFTVELKSPVANARVNLTLAGTLKEPQFSR